MAAATAMRKDRKILLKQQYQPFWQLCENQALKWCFTSNPIVPNFANGGINSDVNRSYSNCKQ
jgi:hypothetical protein